MRCAMCGDSVEFLGRLGNLLWFRCGACGLDQAREVDPEDRGKVWQGVEEEFEEELNETWPRKAGGAR